jgi:hypothetical protein
LLQAKKQGKVLLPDLRDIKILRLILKMLSHDFPFDIVQMPLNCLDATFRTFETKVLPELNRPASRLWEGRA